MLSIPEEAKRIIISVAGSDGRTEYKDIAILPGTQPRDVLPGLDLDQYILNRPQGGAFAMTDNLYPEVQEGDKLYATLGDVIAG